MSEIPAQYMIEALTSQRDNNATEAAQLRALCTHYENRIKELEAALAAKKAKK